jgi:hypothetical protein
MNGRQTIQFANSAKANHATTDASTELHRDGSRVLSLHWCAIEAWMAVCPGYLSLLEGSGRCSIYLPRGICCELLVTIWLKR